MVIFRQQTNFGPNVIYFVLGTSIENQQMQIQEGHFLKLVLNLVLTLSDDWKCLALLISCGIRCILRRVMVILLQQKNFGPNVIYFAFGIINHGE